MDVDSTAPTASESKESSHFATDFGDPELANGSVDPRISVTDIKGSIDDIKEEEDPSYLAKLTKETEGIN